jgi:hypothetical protein
MRNIRTGFSRLVALVAIAYVGVASAADNATSQALYLGYYQEDPLTNPEDPTAGAFVLTLPVGDGAFKGSMFFTYVGCQTSNVGEVQGLKKGNALSGTWSGTIDGSPESGPHEGTFDPSAGYYKGTYEVSGGKQFKSIAGCIEYYIAPDGRWELFPVNRSEPAGFRITVTGAAVSWDVPPGALMSLVYVVDPGIAGTAANPIKWQTILPGSRGSVDLSSMHLTSGKRYIISALISGKKSARIAFASRDFLAP